MTNKHTPSPLSIEVLVAQWDAIVATIERGYTLTFDDYLNDVDLRNNIEQRVRDAAATHRAEHKSGVSVKPYLDAIDARFIASTRSVATCVWGESNARDEGWTPEREWWYYREPLTVTDWA